MYIRKLTKQVMCNYDGPIAHTPLGDLRGVMVEDGYIFRGIKYCNARRFHQPEPIQPWAGVKDAIKYGYACPETSVSTANDQYIVPHLFYPQFEDCQYLNVWTPTLDPSARRPVLVWLHGGGFASGSGIEHYGYDGENLSQHGNAVVVTLNHRLNVLGHLDLSAYGEEYANSGNAGIADIVEALRWIKLNIASFGGNPDQVMIFGQSGGGGKVITLLQSPAADGLYHTAVIQSGVLSPGPDAEVQHLAKRMATLLLEELGLTADTVRQIETIPYYELAQASEKANARLRQETGKRCMWGPVPGDYYAGYPLGGSFRKETLHIPTMMGSVFAEFTSNFPTEENDGRRDRWTADEAALYLQRHFGDAAAKVGALFNATYPDHKSGDAIFMDVLVRRNTVALAKQRAAQGAAQVYCYLFDLDSPFNNGMLAWHNGEIPFIFHNADYLEASYIPGVSERVQDEMSGAWVNFCIKGDPNHDGLPTWDQVTPTSCPTMIFSVHSHQRTDYDDDLLAAIPEDQVIPPYLRPKKEN